MSVRTVCCAVYAKHTENKQNGYQTEQNFVEILYITFNAVRTVADTNVHQIAAFRENKRLSLIIIP